MFVNYVKRNVTFVLPFRDFGCFENDRVDVLMHSLHC